MTDQPKPPIARCRSCGASIIWAITQRGVRIPLDAEPNPIKGNTMIDPETIIVNGHAEEQWRARQVAPLLDGAQTRYMPHHATCPQGRSWRR